jgi:hypothetical protein
MSNIIFAWVHSSHLSSAVPDYFEIIELVQLLIYNSITNEEQKEKNLM